MLRRWSERRESKRQDREKTRALGDAVWSQYCEWLYHHGLTESSAAWHAFLQTNGYERDGEGGA